MPVPASTRKAIQAIREFIAFGSPKDAGSHSAYSLVHHLFQELASFCRDPEALDALLEIAPELEAYRGRGCQVMLEDYTRKLCGVTLLAVQDWQNRSGAGERSSDAGPPPEGAAAAPFWAEKLSDHFFARVQGKPPRSSFAGRLRFEAWQALGLLSDVRRRPEHLAHALKIAANRRHSEDERRGAVLFLVDYWSGEEPDEDTAAVLRRIRSKPPSRSFLAGVLEAEIELGLNGEFGALMEVEDWDEGEDE